MTRRTNARIAGFAFLIYIAAGIGATMLASRAYNGAEGTAARLAAIAQHLTYVRLAFILNLLTCFAALALAVTLYALTRDEDRDIAMLAFACRVAEGVMGGIFVSGALGRLWLATSTGIGAPDNTTSNVLATLFSNAGAWNTGATFFAVGSALFSWLLLRGRTIPVPLAWLGIVASILLVVCLPLQLTGVISGTAMQLIWMPMLAFEVPLGFWLLIKKIE
ncbi:MAG TPA: DUF4386 domain-containing protein [Pyrinomonadaceae bacterium]|nr:DUF4386 domain-containing protein [Pyrinomonadaceae bacterium]